jgi:hypothetical protein
MTSLHLNDDQFTRYLMDPDADGAEAAHLLVCTVCRSHGVRDTRSRALPTPPQEDPRSGRPVGAGV